MSLPEERTYRVAGSIVDANTCGSFREEMRNLLEKPGNIILDLESVRTVDSSCMVIFVETHKALMECDCELKLINIHSSVYEKLTITRLDAIISCTRKRGS